jgi:hypothetical protein
MGRKMSALYTVEISVIIPMTGNASWRVSVQHVRQKHKRKGNKCLVFLPACFGKMLLFLDHSSRFSLSLSQERNDL